MESGWRTATPRPCQMALSTLGSGTLTPMRDMVEEFRYGLMARSTKDTGRGTWPMVEED